MELSQLITALSGKGSQITSSAFAHSDPSQGPASLLQLLLLSFSELLNVLCVCVSVCVCVCVVVL